MAVLHDRVEEAFQPEAVSEQALTTIADRFADNSGDCRQALELLHRAGRNAERADAETVTAARVERTITQG